jgi:hypothetical protein
MVNRNPGDSTLKSGANNTNLHTTRATFPSTPSSIPIRPIACPVPVRRRRPRKLLHPPQLLFQSPDVIPQPALQLLPLLPLLLVDVPRLFQLLFHPLDLRVRGIRGVHGAADCVDVLVFRLRRGRRVPAALLLPGVRDEWACRRGLGIVVAAVHWQKWRKSACFSWVVFWGGRSGSCCFGGVKELERGWEVCSRDVPG